MNASDLEKHDQSDQEEIEALTKELKHTLISTEDIVLTARTIENSTWNSRNSNYSQFWNEQVVPNVVQILTDDVKLRAVIAKFLQSIRNLSICVAEGADMIKLTKGTPGSISIAKRTISAAINAIEDCIKEASTLDDTAVARAANGIGELHGMIKSEAEDFERQKAEINSSLEECNKEQEEFNSRLQSQTGKFQRLHKLIRNMEQLIEDAMKYSELIKSSTDEMIVRNERDERRIGSIPDKIQKSVSEKCDCMVFCHRTHQYTIEEPNSKGMALKNQLKARVAQRKAQIHENTDKQSEQKNFLIDFKYQLDTYRNEYTTVQNEIQRCNSQSEMKMQTIRKNIDKLRQDLTDNESKAAAFRREFGPAITDNLTQVAALNNSLRQENSAGSQIASILKALKRPVQDSLAWLTSGDEQNAYHATKRLLKQAAFLASYFTSTSTLLQPSPKYSALKTTI